MFLDHYSIDVMGPDREASFLIRLQEGEELVGVVAVKCQGAPEEEAAIERDEELAEGAEEGGE